MNATRLWAGIPVFRRSFFVKAILTVALALCCWLPNQSAAQGPPGEWAWMGGDSGPLCGTTGSTTDCGPIYGVEYEFAPGNRPGIPQNSTKWTDSTGRLWLFGVGSGDDLWVFDPAQGEHGEWAWMGGPSSPATSVGVYGTEFQFAPGNWPGSRASAASWVDKNGRLWMFGGSGTDSVGNGGYLNDLWLFDPARGTHGEWAWMGGPQQMACIQVYACQGVETVGDEYQFAAGNLPWGVANAITWVDPAGRFWLFGGRSFDYPDGSDSVWPSNRLWVFDPSLGTNGEWAWMGGGTLPGSPESALYGTEYVSAAANLPGARDDASAWVDQEGNLWLFGGFGFGSNSTILSKQGMLNDLWVFYPTHGDHGEWAWMGGNQWFWKGYQQNTIGQKGIYGTEYTFGAANIPGSRYLAASWTDRWGRFWLFGGQGADAGGHQGYLNDLWEFDPAKGAHGEWAWMGGDPYMLAYGSVDWVSLPGIYGTEYQPDATNKPGGRWSTSAAWTDPNGDMWLFGGFGGDAIGYTKQQYWWFNDLWRFHLYLQTIAFPELPQPLTYGAAITLSATATSGLPVTYKLSSGPGQLSGTNNSTLTLTGSGAAVIVNAYQAGDSEYSAATVATQSRWVYRAPLTVAADSQTMQYGGTVPTLTWTPTGFVNGDTASVLAGSPTLSTLATSTSPIGIYKIQILQNTLAAANYLPSFKPGQLTVQKAPLAITADNLTITYGQPIPTLSWTPTGFVNGDTGSVLTGTPTLSTSAISTSGPGTYPIKIVRNTLAAANYQFTTFTPGTLTIQPLGTMAAPVFHPAGGTYTGPLSVVITTPSGGGIVYTTDGSTPSATNGTIYKGPFTISGSATINAIVMKKGYTSSAIASATYTIQ